MAPAVLLFMAYTADYTLGRLCEAVNRAYCARHGYTFRCEVLAPEAMQAAIAPRTCCSWCGVGAAAARGVHRGLRSAPARPSRRHALYHGVGGLHARRALGSARLRGRSGLYPRYKVLALNRLLAAAVRPRPPSRVARRGV